MSRHSQLPLIETDLARTFVAICDTGSFSRAADRVARTPSAVSLQMKKLEEILRRELFVREGRTVRLTSDGEAFLGYARRLMDLNEETVSRFLTQGIEGRVVFGAPDDIGYIAVPQILKRFASTHPQVEVDVKLRSSDDLRRLCDAGELDLAVLACGEYGQRKVTIVHTENLVWAGLKHGGAIAREPLPLALASRGCAWRAIALDALDAANVRYRIAYSSGHSQGQIAAVLADLAIAPLPESHVTAPLQKLGAAEGLPPLRQYEVALMKRRGCSAVADALAEHVVASFADLQPSPTLAFA